MGSKRNRELRKAAKAAAENRRTRKNANIRTEIAAREHLAKTAQTESAPARDFYRGARIRPQTLES